MRVYAGIDEAGYGPLLGPMVIGCSALAIDDSPAASHRLQAPPEVDFWALMQDVLCRELLHRKGRIAVNDSKKLHTQASGIKHLELGVLAFASLAGLRPATMGEFLTLLGETAHHDLSHLPWYHASEHAPWQALPGSCGEGELAVARGMLQTAASDAKLKVLTMRAAVVFEDRFNHMVAATRSKASASFTFVAGHLLHLWEHWGMHHPLVAVDRQSGRMHYREVLQLYFPEAAVRVLEESAASSVYELRDEHGQAQGKTRRAMTIRFDVEGDGRHMPTALASMLSKYTREQLMARFQSYFERHLPEVKPTAGYGQDARRFWDEIEPRLGELAISAELLKRSC